MAREYRGTQNPEEQGGTEEESGTQERGGVDTAE